MKVLLSNNYHLSFNTFLIHTGFLDTLTSTADSKDCPGVCIHTLATIICYEVLEDIPCPSSNMQCCVESSSVNKTSAIAAPTPTINHHHQQQQQTKIDKQATRPPQSLHPATKVPRPTQKPTEESTDNNDDDDDDEDENSNNNISSNAEKKEDSNTENCPGVCVSDRIAEYCEAYLITQKLCKLGSKCCVSRDIYPDKIPADLRIPNHQHASNATASTPLPPMKKTAINQELKRVK